jgi:hypothetical protein
MSLLVRDSATFGLDFLVFWILDIGIFRQV